jgi:serine/threonine protein kinase
MADRIGQRIGGYRLVRFLGRGTYGEVYLGEHVRDQSQAAVKLLSAQMTEAELKQFIKEASTAARMKHPHIVELLGFGLHHDDTPYLITTYAPHGSLRQRHPSGSRVAGETIVVYVKQIAEALHYMHSDRRIHRDIKPENILIGSNQQLLLADFGITIEALATGYVGLQQDANGTMAYAAPEQIRKQALPASDQYALAIMVYEWLYGARPFTGDILQVMYQQLEVAPPSLQEHEPTIATEVEHVVMKALAKQPEQRYESVEAFAHQLGQAGSSSARKQWGLLFDRHLEQMRARKQQDQQDQWELLAGLIKWSSEHPSPLPDIQIPGVNIEKRLDKRIYLAKRLATGQLMVLKHFGSVYHHPDQELRYQKESFLLRLPHHPHLVQYLDGGQSDQDFYLLMEYCDSGSLEDLTRSLSPRLLPPQEACVLLSQAIAGLAYLHNCGIVHCKLSPESILLHREGKHQQAKIAGLGLAKPLVGGKNWIEELVETEDDFMYPYPRIFSAPRTWTSTLSNQFQFVNDVWSMGAICHFVLTGQPPWELKPGEDPPDASRRNSSLPILQRNPLLSRPLAQVIDRALATDLADRYQDGQQMHTAFAQALQRAGM